jgi:hypothetical protein
MNRRGIADYPGLSVYRTTGERDAYTTKYIPLRSRLDHRPIIKDVTDVKQPVRQHNSSHQ